MDIHCETILEQYRKDSDSFAIIRDLVAKQLREIVDSRGMLVNSIDSRIKTEQSLAGKLELKGHKYRSLFDITDIVGARIVTFYEDEVDTVASDVEKVFEIDWENSVDKRKMYDPDRFGYMSLHYICKIPESMYSNPDHPEVNQYHFEIQMRTTLQHVWATIYHDTGYKSDVEVPKAHIRQLNRLASLLELADDEFKGIRDNIDAYRESMRALLAEKKYEEVELDGDAWANYLTTRPFDELVNRIAKINDADVSEINLTYYLEILKGLGFKTLADVEALIERHSEDAFKYAESGLRGTDIDIVSESVGLQNLLLVHVYVCKGLHGIKHYFDLLRGKQDRNEASARRVFKRMESVGIKIKEED